MKGPKLQIDERNVTTTRKICTRLYMATIGTLWLDVLWRQFILRQPLSEFGDLAALMTANVIMFIGAILYYGGVTLPKIRISVAVGFYLVCVVVGTAFTAYRYNLSSVGEILGKLVLVAAIAGCVVVLYIFVAYLGSRKTDRELEE
jgi:hypothetical protein